MADHDQDNEYFYSILRLNFTHLVHPPKITIVLHEMLHPLVQSRGFRAALRSFPEGLELDRRLCSPPRDSQENFERERLEEMLVEYLLARLLFHDRGDLYVRCYLRQLALHPESFCNRKQENAMVLVEHLARCFLLAQLLEHDPDASRPEWAPQALAERFDHHWWPENVRYFLNERASGLPYSKDQYRAVTKETWQSWLRGDLSCDLKAIRQGVDVYFGSSQCAYEEDSISHRLRRDFITRLDDYRKDASFIGSLRESLEQGQAPIHLVFARQDGQRERRERPLRMRRLESLIGYLCLTRAFYEILDSWFQKDPDVALHVTRTEGEVDFHGAEWNDVLLDPLRGTIYTVGDDKHEAYTSLRLAFLKSMWHLAEITKHSEIAHVLALGNKLNNYPIPVPLFLPPGLIDENLEPDWEWKLLQQRAVPDKA